MKAKRIVSILLTGSMLLSLLPVSALAAAPVFDAPAQTTAKKAAPLVQEADVSRSTEEEAATRSSRVSLLRDLPNLRAAPPAIGPPTGAPSPAAPSKEKRPTGAPSPAGPLKRKCCS